MTELLVKSENFKYKIKKEKFSGMLVDGIIYASENLIRSIQKEETYKQIINVAHLPGIVEYSIGMPDIHWGYGFPIGGIAAIDAEEGVISPGGVGSDINCGVRAFTTPLFYNKIKNKINDLLNLIYHKIPAGVGLTGKIHLNRSDLSEVARTGARWAVSNGLGFDEDLENIEDQGSLKEGSLDPVSKIAIKRGLDQLGTLGAGNHFIEIQRVEKIFNSDTASKFGLREGQITVMVHTGSRGFGYQICSDYLQAMQGVMRKYKIVLPDQQLASAPIRSKEGKDYFSAMAAASNYAWANREIIGHFIREAFQECIDCDPKEIKLLYDVAHNIAKFEKHKVRNRVRDLLVHRKGATRAFGPGTIGLPDRYKSTGQPVIIPGDMGTASYILSGSDVAMKETFGTVCHGAGRVLSRRKAKQIADKEKLYSDLKKDGITLKASSWRSVAEEIPEAYKDIDEIIRVVTESGLAQKIARLRPVGVIKG
ncbi:MAG: RtcB family protein [Spirochaetes bacterium]|nr:RtcB family protein [Spirochaetota bacterium]